MPRSKLLERFPCGYKKTSSLFTLFGRHYFSDDGKGCPLHGKDCRREGEKQNRLFEGHDKIKKDAIDNGVDTDKLENEYEEIMTRIGNAILNIKSKKTFGGIFYNPYLGPGILKTEVEKEFYRLESNGVPISKKPRGKKE